MSTDDDDDGGNTNHHTTNTGDNQISPNSDQTVNPSNSLSPAQITMTNGMDDVSTTTPTIVKVERDNGFHCLSPPSALVQTLPNKMTLTTNVPALSSLNSSRKMTGTLNRLLHSAVNRPNGHHHYHHQHQQQQRQHHNGLSSSPSASSSTTITTLVDSTAKEPKTNLEMSTHSIESMRKIHVC